MLITLSFSMIVESADHFAENVDCQFDIPIILYQFDPLFIPEKKYLINLFFNDFLYKKLFIILKLYLLVE